MEAYHRFFKPVCKCDCLEWCCFRMIDSSYVLRVNMKPWLGNMSLVIFIFLCRRTHYILVQDFTGLIITMLLCLKKIPVHAFLQKVCGIEINLSSNSVYIWNPYLWIIFYKWRSMLIYSLKKDPGVLNKTVQCTT